MFEVNRPLPIPGVVGGVITPPGMTVHVAEPEATPKALPPIVPVPLPVPVERTPYQLEVIDATYAGHRDITLRTYDERGMPFDMTSMMRPQLVRAIMGFIETAKEKEAELAVIKGRYEADMLAASTLGNNQLEELARLRASEADLKRQVAELTAAKEKRGDAAKR